MRVNPGHRARPPDAILALPHKCQGRYLWLGMTRRRPGAIGLDQIYTKPAVANRCLRFLFDTLDGLADLRRDRVFYVELSAGEGCFLDLLPPGRCIGIDIEPRRAGIIRHNFLTWPFGTTIEDPRQTVVVGNPPLRPPVEARHPVLQPGDRHGQHHRLRGPRPVPEVLGPQEPASRVPVDRNDGATFLRLLHPRRAGLPAQRRVPGLDQGGEPRLRGHAPAEPARHPARRLRDVAVQQHALGRSRSSNTTSPCRGRVTTTTRGGRPPRTAASAPSNGSCSRPEPRPSSTGC